jgi:hypothetical protein
MSGGRLVLDLRVRNWLGRQPLLSEVVVVAASPAGLLVIREDLTHRREVLSR